MDELSIAASIISLGIQVTQSLINYYKAYKEHKSDIVNTAEKLKNLLHGFESMRRQLPTGSSEPTRKAYSRP
jgi:hypothetical protein